MGKTAAGQRQEEAEARGLSPQSTGVYPEQQAYNQTGQPGQPGQHPYGQTEQQYAQPQAQYPYYQHGAESAPEAVPTPPVQQQPTGPVLSQSPPPNYTPGPHAYEMHKTSSPAPQAQAQGQPQYYVPPAQPGVDTHAAYAAQSQQQPYAAATPQAEYAAQSPQQSYTAADQHAAYPGQAPQQSYADAYAQQQQQQQPQAQAQAQPQAQQYQQQAQQPQPQTQAQPQPAGATTTGNVVHIGTLTRAPMPVDCPVCGKRGVTRIDHQAGTFTHLLALGLCVCVCLGCIPYCIDDTKDVEHKCSNCGTLLATYQRMGGTIVNAQAA